MRCKKLISSINGGIDAVIHPVNTVKVLLSLLVFTFLFSISSCTDTEEEFQTFLEKNDHTEWKLQNDTLNVYIRINRADSPYIEQWYYMKDLQCFEYNPNIFVPGDCRTRENSADQFIVQGDAVLSDYSCMTFTRSGNRLKVDINLCDGHKETVYFILSEVSVDGLVRCAEPVKSEIRFMIGGC